jgi:hypothetical protein
MSKLGYTWYPKDWNNSEAVFELTLQQRGLYRELIDLAMLNDNKTIIKPFVWVRKWNIPQKDLNNILTVLTDLDLIEVNKDCLFIPSCEPRLNLVRGGKKGGKNKPTPKPIVKPTPKPTPKQKKEKGKERESKEESIAERKQSFRQSLTDFNKSNPSKYPKQLFIDFEMYWTEAGPKDKKMRFEKEKTFGIASRLSTWFKRDLNGTYKAKVKRLNTFD